MVAFFLPRFPMHQKGIKLIVDNCVELSELALVSFPGRDAVTYLCKNLTSKIRKLTIRPITTISDNDVEILTKRCKDLTCLQIGGPLGLSNQGLTIIIKNLSQSLEKLAFAYHHSRNIHLEKFLEFQKMTKLTHLCLVGCQCRPGMKEWKIFFEKHFPKLRVTFDTEQ